MSTDTSSKKRSNEKEFQIRNSPLTDRFENSEDIRTIYNLFAVILISLLNNTIIDDYTKTKELHFGLRTVDNYVYFCYVGMKSWIIPLRLIISGFNKFDLVIILWCCFNFLALSVYYLFKWWARIRILLKPKTIKFWDQIWLSLLVVYYLSSLYGIQKVTATFKFAPGSATVLFLEHIRLLMKQHSFIRANVPQVTNFKLHNEQILILPNLQKFVYFLFAPTLLYRDQYPRTKQIRWKFVFYNFAEVLGIIFLLSLVVERFLIPPFEDICSRKFTLSEILIPVLGNSFPGVLFILCGFYSVLHSFQNAFAEMLRFGDRMFYKDWWTSRSLSEYFRTWNVIVHDWLFTYVYKDMYEIVIPKNKMVAKLTVFVLSAIIHEWIMTNVLGLFLPIQFTQFFITGAVLALFNILDLRVGNLVVWYLIVFGSGMQVNLYALEFMARINCPSPPAQGGIFEFLTPRFIACACIE